MRDRSRCPDARATPSGRKNVIFDRPSQWEMANLTPHRIETHEPTATKFRTIDYVREGTPKPNLVEIHPLGASGHMSET